MFKHSYQGKRNHATSHLRRRKRQQKRTPKMPVDHVVTLLPEPPQPQ
jgi:hypothetical protein